MLTHQLSNVTARSLRTPPIFYVKSLPMYTKVCLVVCFQTNVYYTGFINDIRLMMHLEMYPMDLIRHSRRHEVIRLVFHSQIG